MLVIYRWSCVFFAFFLIGSSFTLAVNNTESLLIRHILKDYSREIRPVQDASRPVTVTFGIMVKQIIKVDFHHQILKLHVWLRLYWKDEFINWNPEDFGGIKTVVIDHKYVWVPSMALYNSASEKSDEIKFNLFYKLFIKHTGEIRWTSPAIISSECKMDVQHFPFDQQQCYLEFGSWEFDGSKVDIKLHLPYVDKESYSENEEWIFSDNKAERREVKYNCCPEPFPSAYFTLVLKRRATFFVLNVIVPCGLITFSSLFSFILPPSSGERISFIMTVLVAFSVYMMIVTEEMPHSSDVPLASKFFIFLMVQQGVSLFASSLIIRFHSNCSKMPKWFEILVNKWLARLLYMQSRNSSIIHIFPETCHIEKTPDLLDKESTNEENVPSQNKVANIKNNKDEASGKDEQLAANSMLKEDLSKILQEIKVPAGHFREIKRKEKLQEDWIYATNVLDRLFLILLLMSVLACVSAIFLLKTSSV